MQGSPVAQPFHVLRNRIAFSQCSAGDVGQTDRRAALLPLEARLEMGQCFLYCLNALNFKAYFKELSQLKLSEIHS